MAIIVEDTPSSSELPSFPLEIHHNILRFCDKPTLAVAARVSVAFLKYCNPRVLRNIDLTIGPQLEMFFCERNLMQYANPNFNPVVHAYTTLLATSKVTLRLTGPAPPNELELTMDRIHPQVESYAVKELTIHTSGSDDASRDVWDYFLGLFAPKSVLISGKPDPANGNRLPRISFLETEHWSATLRTLFIRSVDLVDEDGQLAFKAFAAGGDEVDKPSLRIEIDMSHWDPKSEFLHGMSHQTLAMVGVLRQEALEVCLAPRGRVECLTVWFASEEALKCFMTLALGSFDGEEEYQWVRAQIVSEKIDLAVRDMTRDADGNAIKESAPEAPVEGSV